MPSAKRVCSILGAMFGERLSVDVLRLTTRVERDSTAAAILTHVFLPHTFTSLHRLCHLMAVMDHHAWRCGGDAGELVPCS